MERTIKQGDVVNVFFTYSAEWKLTVLYSPSQNDEECWMMKRQDGTPVNIKQYEIMELIKE